MGSVEIGRTVQAGTIASSSGTIDSFSLGRAFYGAAVAASGVQQLMTGAFVRLVPDGASGPLAQPPWPQLAGAVLLAAGLAIASGRAVRLAATAVATMLVLSLAFRQVPRAVANPWAGFMWTNPLKGLSLFGGALLAAASAPKGRPMRGVEATAAWLLAVFLMVCGVQHFFYRDFVVTLVPAWIPGPMGWTCFTGVALFLGGGGMLTPPVARLAATLSGVMLLLWVPLVHIPRALAGPNHPGESAGIFEALAVSGVAFMVAGTRGPWRARGPNSARPE